MAFKLFKTCRRMLSEMTQYKYNPAPRRPLTAVEVEEQSLLRDLNSRRDQLRQQITSESIEQTSARLREAMQADPMRPLSSLMFPPPEKEWRSDRPSPLPVKRHLRWCRHTGLWLSPEMAREHRLWMSRIEQAAPEG